MELLSAAAKFIFGVIAEDETVKGFPKEFVAESAKWIKSWFLKPEDPVTTSLLENKTLPEAVKKPVIEAKLKALETNPDFMQQLKAQLDAFEQQKSARMIQQNAEKIYNIEKIDTAHFS